MANPDVASPPVLPNKSLTDSAFAQVLQDYRLMLRYTLSEGLDLDDKTQELIEKVPVEPQIANFGDLLAAHVALSKVVAPATPLSLEATEPVPGPLGSLRHPPLIIWMIGIAGLAILGFVITDFLIRIGGGQGVEVWNWFFAAMLGAVFYVLFTAHDYVKNRTFDPRYNTVYVIRFALGILSGLILAVVLSKYILGQNSQLASLGPAVLALLGGFSTEGVYQILQRLVDVLLATVRGDNSDAAKAKASEAAQKELLVLADDPAMPPELRSKAIAAAKKVAA